MNKYEKALDTIDRLIERDILDAYSKAPEYNEAMKVLTELVTEKTKELSKDENK